MPNTVTDTAAIILGASGSVGRALLAVAAKPGQFQRVILVVRRTLGEARDAGNHVTELLVPEMTPPSLSQAVAECLAQCDGPAVGFSVLGIGAGTANMTIDEHRAVDVDLNAAFAAGLRASAKVDHLVFMSAVGASVTASASGSGAAGMPRYARVKGEAERAVLAAGPEIVSILRPSVIIGSQHTPRALAAALSVIAPVLPAKYRPIRATEIAQAMVALARHRPSSSSIYSFAEIRSLAARVD